jgi:UDP-N-acetylmuramoyl-tripeptide--D-alanyl-D-alanine ligase
VELELPFTQRHQAMNTLAALNAYAALGLPMERAWEGVSDIQLSPWRGEEIPLGGGGFVINDAYNANPDSMRAALLHLAERAPNRHKIAVLGEMAELGPESEVYHRAIGELATELRIEVVGVGQPASAYGPVIWAQTVDDTMLAVRSLLRPGDVVLVKASRSVGLEGIADEIANIARAWSPY